ncbi:MAG: DUF2269 family protein [Acidimicrobiales bacterium]
MGEDVGVHHQPDGPAFDVVLILHVGCVVVGLTTTVAGAVNTARLRTLLRTATPLPDALRRYFRPGVNWAGRTVYGIPIFGFGLLALSHGTYGLRDGWVLGGLTIFVGVVLIAEGVLWPAERRLQVSLAAAPGGAPAKESVHRDARAMMVAATVTVALLVAGSALMVVQP